jgi:hypothetical protein
VEIPASQVEFASTPDDVVKGIEERETTAQTIVDKGLALPHATIEWTGDFRVVLGRSQAGVLLSDERNRVVQRQDRQRQEPGNFLEGLHCFDVCPRCPEASNQSR